MQGITSFLDKALQTHLYERERETETEYPFVKYQRLSLPFTHILMLLLFLCTSCILLQRFMSANAKQKSVGSAAQRN